MALSKRKLLPAFAAFGLNDKQIERCHYFKYLSRLLNDKSQVIDKSKDHKQNRASNKCFC